MKEKEKGRNRLLSAHSNAAVKLRMPFPGNEHSAQSCDLKDGLVPGRVLRVVAILASADTDPCIPTHPLI